jgi:hypothetical protein
MTDFIKKVIEIPNKYFNSSIEGFSKSRMSQIKSSRQEEIIKMRSEINEMESKIRKQRIHEKGKKTSN